MARVVKITDSSNINTVTYFRDTEGLIVKFSQGGTYAYEGIKPEIFGEFVSADSVGVYFARNIRDRFDSVKVG